MEGTSSSSGSRESHGYCYWAVLTGQSHRTLGPSCVGKCPAGGPYEGTASHSSSGTVQYTCQTNQDGAVPPACSSLEG